MRDGERADGAAGSNAFERPVPSVRVVRSLIVRGNDRVVVGVENQSRRWLGALAAMGGGIGGWFVLCATVTLSPDDRRIILTLIVLAALTLAASLLARSVRVTLDTRSRTFTSTLRWFWIPWRRRTVEIDAAALAWGHGAARVSVREPSAWAGALGCLFIFAHPVFSLLLRFANRRIERVEHHLGLVLLGDPDADPTLLVAVEDASSTDRFLDRVDQLAPRLTADRDTPRHHH